MLVLDGKMKPKFSIDIGGDAPSSLEAHRPLEIVSDGRCFHTARNLRMPLGIYNISISRVCDKLLQLCQRLETYFKASSTLDGMPSHDDVMQGLIDYIELSIYAAAEHVDDLDSIAAGFFAEASLRHKNSAYKDFRKEIKILKKFLSSAANAIKHQQSRIRLFSMEYFHGGIPGCLHGYFIEGVEDGIVCPSSKFHHSQDVFSVTTLVWEVVVLLLRSSRALMEFMGEISTRSDGEATAKSGEFARVIIAAARLPIYTFGEEHPFSRATVQISSSGGNYYKLRSGLYGSISNKWSKTAGASFGNFKSWFAGDGKTNSFRGAQPKSISLHHWS
jgi:hypothetical protein